MVRRAELLLFVLVLPFLFTGTTGVRGSYVVAGIESHVSLHYGDDLYEFNTYKTTLLDAVNEQGIKVYDQDMFSMDRGAKLYGQSVKVNIVKSLPVVIDDNGEHYVGRTVFSRPEKILDQNNIKFWPEDKLSIELITDPITSGGVGQLVTIKRAPVYKVAVDGKTKEVRTWDTNVKVIVQKSGTKVNPNDIVNPALKSKVVSGAVIKITRINYAEVSETESIPFKTVYQGSTALRLGETQAAVSGVTGSKKMTYKVTYKNGEVVSRVLISSKITKFKRDAKILRGAETGRSNFGYYDGMVTSFHNATPSMIGRYLLVTNLANGKSVKVRIIGSGPYNGPLMDMGTKPFQMIGGSLRDGFLPHVMVQLID